jgi:hypothetical protein
MYNQRNTKKQGDVGLGVAIGYFTEIGWTVCVPLTDSQDYDLVVDDGNHRIRVQIKTTTYKRNPGNYVVSLTVKGGNRTSVGKIKKFDKEAVDALFIATGDGGRYYIPIRELIPVSTVTLSTKYDRFRV